MIHRFTQLLTQDETISGLCPRTYAHTNLVMRYPGFVVYLMFASNLRKDMIIFFIHTVAILEINGGLGGCSHRRYKYEMRVLTRALSAPCHPSLALCMCQRASLTYLPQVFTSFHLFNKIVRSRFTVRSPYLYINWVKIHCRKNKVG